MKNFEIIDSKERISYLDAERIYRDAQYLMINIDDKNGIAYGNVYAVSRDSSTLSELVKMESKLQEQGIECLIGGEYSNSLFNSVEIISMQRIKNG